MLCRCFHKNPKGDSWNYYKEAKQVKIGGDKQLGLVFMWRAVGLR
jgi:hypothetical protein